MLVLISEIRAAAPATPRHDFDKLVSQVHEFMAGVAQNGSLMRALLEAIMVNPMIEDAWYATHTDTVRSIAVRMQEDLGHGFGAREVDPKRVAPAIGAMAEWYAFTQFSLRKRSRRVSSKELAVAAEVLADLSYHAAYAAAPKRLGAKAV